MLKNSKHSKESIIKISEYRKNKRWMTNGNRNVFVHEKEIDEYKNEGFIFGKKQRPKVWITNGLISRNIDKEDLSRYIAEGWFKGRLF